MNAHELWKKYMGENSEENYQLRTYKGEDPQSLIRLTLSGVKTATSHVYDIYLNGEPLPVVGGYNILLNEKGDAVCITKTTKLTILPFGDVPEEHALKEGESDRTAEGWKKLYKDIFMKELENSEEDFEENCIVVLEEFQLMYPLQEDEEEELAGFYG